MKRTFDQVFETEKEIDAFVCALNKHILFKPIALSCGNFSFWESLNLYSS